MSAADEARAEAHRRYEPSKLIEDYDGDRYVDDDWGYDECQRKAFVAGAEWRAGHKAATDKESLIVRTTEELDALPDGSVIREANTGPFLGIQTIPGVFEKWDYTGVCGWAVVAGHGVREVEKIDLPATVLWTPGGTGR